MVHLQNFIRLVKQLDRYSLRMYSSQRTETPVMEQPIPTWVSQLFQPIIALIPKQFTGQIEVNCFKGGISNINIKQSYKKENVT